MIRKITMAVAACLAASLTFAQLPVTVTGVLKTTKLSEMKLFAVQEGKPVVVASCTPSESGKFGFMFYPSYEGFYMVGNGNPLAPNGNNTFYFKPGDKLNLQINDSTYQLIGNTNSPENKVMEQWFNKSYAVMRKSIYFMKSMSTYEDFFPQFSVAEPQLSAYIKTVKTSNPVFNKVIKNYLEADLGLIAINYLNTPRTKHPGPDVIKPDYYNRFDITRFTKNTDLFNYPYGFRTLGSMLSFAMRPVYTDSTFDKSAESMLNKQLSYVLNDTLKGEIVLMKLESMKSYVTYLDLFDKYKQYLFTDLQKKRAFDKQTALAEFKPGVPGYNFKYPDTTGTEFSLASFKGKVVLIDVWATWCGPCKAEIPYLQALEEEMKGKNVAFVSISVDEEKDKEKWKQFVKEKSLGGTQLYAKGWSDITKFYQITGIPRFLLFDKEGKLITHDSPRPSTPDLKKLIEKYL